MHIILSRSNSPLIHLNLRSWHTIPTQPFPYVQYGRMIQATKILVEIVAGPFMGIQGGWGQEEPFSSRTLFPLRCQLPLCSLSSPMSYFQRWLNGVPTQVSSKIPIGFNGIRGRPMFCPFENPTHILSGTLHFLMLSLDPTLQTLTFIPTKWAGTIFLE